ncbi:MAG: hypothetical protein ACR2MG_05240 [Pyrinomonadaceae bacterium]
MKTKKLKFAIYTLTAFFCLTLFFPASANAQRRDYLTDEEVELVRDAQEIDLRIGILTKAIDRRFLVLNNDNSQAKKVEKDLDKWGELPKGSRSALLSDIERILQKAIDDIDGVAEHKNMDVKLFPKAVFGLTGACQSYIPQLKTLYDSIKDEKEKGSILGAIDNCNQVIEASAKVPKETPKEKKKKKDS